MDEQLLNAGVLTIEDGNTWGKYLIHLNKYVQSCTIRPSIVSTAMYSTHPVKALEWKRRGITEKPLVKGASTTKPSDWKPFLCNERTQDIANRNGQHSTGRAESNLGYEWRCLPYRLGRKHSWIDVKPRSNRQYRCSLLHLCCRTGIPACNGQKPRQGYIPDRDISCLGNRHFFFNTGQGSKKRFINITHISKDYI